MRRLYLFICLACAGLLGAAAYMQATQGLFPCPLCVFQRLAYWGLGLTALLAFLHDPQRTGRRIYASLLLLFSLSGGLTAIRQAWLVRHPDAFSCGLSLEEQIINALPLARWWPDMFGAIGNCASADWKLFSLTMPEWSAIWFVILAVTAIYTLVGNRR